MPGQLLQVDVGDLTFDVRVDGPDDGRPVLLLHGFPQTSASWAAVTPLLTEAGLRTYAPDQLGYSPGARPAEVGAYALPSLAQVTADLMTALDAPRADVVGHDWGANVDWALAAWHADRVRSLTAVSVPHPAAFTAAYRADPEQRERSAYIRLFWQEGRAEELLLADGARRLRRMLTGGDGRATDGRATDGRATDGGATDGGATDGGAGGGARTAGAGADRGTDGGTDGFADGGPATGIPAEAVDQYVAALSAPGALTAALNWYRAMSSGARVDPVAVPTTYVWSDGDVAIGRTAAEACADHVTGDYRFVELPGITHWVPEQAPRELAAAILDRVASS